MKDPLKHFKPSSGGNPQNVYKPVNGDIVFIPRTEDDDKKAEMMADIMKYHLEND